MSRPIAVLIADVHYNVHTLEVADQAVRVAIAKSIDLDVPIVVCGDLHDTKANIRGECINAMLHTFSMCHLRPIILRGNHCSINERSKEHSLSFLDYLAHVVKDSDVVSLKGLKVYLKSYESDPEQMRAWLSKISKGSTIIIHQGVQNSSSGHYIKDHSALTKEDLAGFRVISGHYHTRQSFDLPDGGKMDYVGNTYSLGFGEANDPEKGFQVLYDDGSLEFVPTNLRKHIVLDTGVQPDGTFAYAPTSHIKPEDIVWVKCSGPSDKLSAYSKKKIKDLLNLKQDFRLDLMPNDTKTTGSVAFSELPQDQLLDNLIDSLSNTETERKERLKKLWRVLK